MRGEDRPAEHRRHGGGHCALRPACGHRPDPGTSSPSSTDRVGTSDDRIEAAVGALTADRVSTRMLLYLSVNSTPPAASVLAPPSGTVTKNLLVRECRR